MAQRGRTFFLLGRKWAEISNFSTLCNILILSSVKSEYEGGGVMVVMTPWNRLSNLIRYLLDLLNKLTVTDALNNWVNETYILNDNDRNFLRVGDFSHSVLPFHKSEWTGSFMSGKTNWVVKGRFIFCSHFRCWRMCSHSWGMMQSRNKWVLGTWTYWCSIWNIFILDRYVRELQANEIKVILILYLLQVYSVTILPEYCKFHFQKEILEKSNQILCR